MCGELELFSEEYLEARTRFREAASHAGMELFAYPIGRTGPLSEELTIDVAVRRSPSQASSTLVVSSGTHGVEGYFGSAVQLFLLSQQALLSKLLSSATLLLIHAVNPYGFAYKRRVNEDNVDQNRNFVLQGRTYAGVPAGYQSLNALLNPDSPPRRLELFWLRAAREVLRSGFLPLKNAVAQGQYEFPRGLFFGGSGPTKEQEIVREHVRSWVGRPERVLHIDLHTGLGRRGRYALAIDLPADHPRVARLRREFGAQYVQGFDPRGVLYEIQGAMGPWLEQCVPDVQYDCLLAEFGTYPSLRVLSAMRSENRVHHFARGTAREVLPARRALLEVFCPRSPGWRRAAIGRAQRLLWQAAAAVCGEA